MSHLYNYLGITIDISSMDETNKGLKIDNNLFFVTINTYITFILIFSLR